MARKQEWQQACFCYSAEMATADFDECVAFFFCYMLLCYAARVG